MTPETVRVRKYFAKLSPKTRAKVKQIRAAIKAVAPRARDAFSYQIPAFRLEGRIFIWYAGFAGHCSLFPMGTAIRKAFKKPLAKYETSKGTVRFPLDTPLPVSLIKRLVRARVREVS